MTPQEVAQADAKIEELKVLHDQIGARIKQLEEAKALQKPEGITKQVAPSKDSGYHQSGDNSLETKLLKLPWSTAKSGRCDYNREVPAALLAEARAAADAKHELNGEKYHYVIKDDGAILRFKRKN